MLQDNDFVKLRQLCDLYYQRQLDFASYRAQRREILDKLEAELNQPAASVPTPVTTQPHPRLERKQREQFADEEDMNNEDSVFPAGHMGNYDGKL